MPRKLIALVRSSHPVPGVSVTVITIVLGIGVGLELWRVVVLGVAMLLGQSSVGLSNDWLDVERDRAVGRSDKPVAAGDVSVNAARAAAFVTAGLALLVTVPLGWAATAAHAVFIISAWAYNLGLKATPASVLPYVVSFGGLPLVVTLAHTPPALASAWALVAGALLGIAAHFGNVLPDFEDDRNTGILGLPHRLGRRSSALVIAAALAATSPSIVLGLGGASGLQWVGLGLGIALAVASAVLAFARPDSRLLFRLIIASALVNVVLLATAGDRILA